MDPAYLVGQIIGIIILIVGVPIGLLVLYNLYKLADEPAKIITKIEIKGDSEKDEDEKESEDEKED